MLMPTDQARSSRSVVPEIMLISGNDELAPLFEKMSLMLACRAIVGCQKDRLLERSSLR